MQKITESEIALPDQLSSAPKLRQPIQKKNESASEDPPIKDLMSKLKMTQFLEEELTMSDLVEVMFSNLRLCEKMNPINDSRDREDISEISDNDSELDDAASAIKSRRFSGYSSYRNKYLQKKSFMLFSSRLHTRRQEDEMDRGVKLLPNLTSHYFLNLARSIEGGPVELDENHRHLDGFETRGTLKLFSKLKLAEATRLETSPFEEAIRQDTLDKLDSIQDIPRIKWNFSYDAVSEEHLQNDYFVILKGFQRMKDILLKGVAESNLSQKLTEKLNALIIDEFANIDLNVVFSLLVSTQGWYFDQLKVRLIDRINQYMMAYVNQEVNLIWIFAQEIWKYDGEFLNPFSGKETVTMRGFFKRWLEISLMRFYMFPLDPMKMDNLTESTLLGAFTRIFDNLVYPLQEANEANYKTLDIMERYYIKLRTIDRLTHMKDELDFEFRKIKREIENIFLRPRPELIDYGRYFLEVYLEKTQKFFPIPGFTKNKKINLRRLFQVLSYFRMVPEDVVPDPQMLFNYPLRQEKDMKANIKTLSTSERFNQMKLFLSETLSATSVNITPYLFDWEFETRRSLENWSEENTTKILFFG